MEKGSNLTPGEGVTGQRAWQPDQILTVAEVAELLRVPISWVYDHVRGEGIDRLPHIKLGKYVRFRASAIREWLEHRQGA